MFEILTVATFQQPKSLERFAAGLSTEPHQRTEVFQPQRTAQYQPRAPASVAAAVVVPSEWFQPANAHHEDRVQHQQAQPQHFQDQPPRPQYQLQHPKLQHQKLQPQSDDVARQIFFENQVRTKSSRTLVAKPVTSLHIAVVHLAVALTHRLLLDETRSVWTRTRPRPQCLWRTMMLAWRLGGTTTGFNLIQRRDRHRSTSPRRLSRLQTATPDSVSWRTPASQRSTRSGRSTP